MFRADMHTESDTDAGPTTRPRKRQKINHAVPKPSDFAPRVSSSWKVGAHVSAAGGVENTIVNAARVRYVSLLLFRPWGSDLMHHHKGQRLCSLRQIATQMVFSPSNKRKRRVFQSTHARIWLRPQIHSASWKLPHQSCKP